MIELQKVIDEAVVAREEKAVRASDAFYTSDAGLCYRMRFMKRAGVPRIKELPVGALRKMLAGSAGHEMLQKLLASSGALESAEDAIGVDDIYGHYDGIILRDKARTLVEFKTIEKFQMGWIKKDGPKPNHLIQLFTYWYFLRNLENPPANLDQAVLSYVKREDFESIDFNYSWDEKKHTAAVISEWSPLIDAWEQKQLPPCTCAQDFGGNGVKYCRYQAKDGESCCAEELYKDTEYDLRGGTTQ